MKNSEYFRFHSFVHEVSVYRNNILLWIYGWTYLCALVSWNGVHSYIYVTQSNVTLNGSGEKASNHADYLNFFSRWNVPQTQNFFLAHSMLFLFLWISSVLFFWFFFVFVGAIARKYYCFRFVYAVLYNLKVFHNIFISHPSFYFRNRINVQFLCLWLCTQNLHSDAPKESKRRFFFIVSACCYCCILFLKESILLLWRNMFYSFTFILWLALDMHLIMWLVDVVTTMLGLRIQHA